MARPWVIVLALLIVASLAAPAIRQYRGRVDAKANPEPRQAGDDANP